MLRLTSFRSFLIALAFTGLLYLSWGACLLVGQDVTAPMPPLPPAPATSSASAAPSVAHDVAVQSLLYDSCFLVIRYNTEKIDYDMLEDFISDFIDKGIGSVESADHYLEELRTYQKEQLKYELTQYVLLLQNEIKKSFLSEYKITDFYQIYYSDDGMQCLAFPVAGIDADKMKKLVDAIQEEINPICVVRRFDFVIAVTGHNNAGSLDLSSIKKPTQKEILAYKTKNQGMMMGGDTMMPPMPTMDSMGNMTTTKPKDESPTGKYEAAVKEAKEGFRKSARPKVLPYVRHRFEKPATAEEAAPFLDAFSKTNGVALAAIFKNIPSDSETVENVQTDMLTPLLKGLEGKITWGAFCISAVKSPRLVFLLRFNDEESTQMFSEIVGQMLNAVKGQVNNYIESFIKEFKLKKADLSPVIDQLFAEMRPQINQTMMAIEIKLDIIKENALAFIPLIGGTETKTASQKEAESIDWSLGNTTPADKSGKSDADNTVTSDDNAADSGDADDNIDDIFDQADDTGTAGPATQDSDSEESTDEEEDPFN